MTTKIISYSDDSYGAKCLAKAMDCEVHYWRTRPLDQSNDKIINWGCSWGFNVPVWLNKWKAIENAVYKRRTYDLLQTSGVNTLEYTNNQGVANSWLTNGHTVYARKTDTGKDGEGISVFSPEGSQFNINGEPYSFYTKGFPTKREFRVYATKDRGIHVLEKRRKRGTSGPDLVRCGPNWVFCLKEEEFIDHDLLNLGQKAIKVVGLDFGGVDVGMDKDGKLIVFEVNSAPGIGPISAQLFAHEFLKENYNV